MKISEKGQVTIPAEIRRRLGLLPECEVEFEVDGRAVKIRKARGRRVAGAVGGGRSSVGCAAEPQFG